jgi:hypothetical protein
VRDWHPAWRKARLVKAATAVRGKRCGGGLLEIAG